MSAAVVELDRDAGDVPTREAPICSHGREGYCYDDASQEERDAYDFLYRAAFDFAYPGGADAAESFATWLVAKAWHPGVFIIDWTLSREFDNYRKAAA
jgi:hypothetical protein